MLAFSVASSVMPPGVVTNLAAPLPARYASTWLAILLNASEMPIETAMPASPPKPNATAAAPAIAEIDEVSDALSEIELGRSPGPRAINERLDVRRDVVLGVDTGPRPRRCRRCRRASATEAEIARSR